MKRVSALLFFGLVSLIFSGSADAQSFFCDRPSKPYVPSGTYEDQWQMKMAQDEVDVYLRRMREYLDCLRMESEDAAAVAKRVLNEWNAAVRLYNLR